jgi:uncharacterized RDD family membrane protein YckC
MEAALAPESDGSTVAHVPTAPDEHHASEESTPTEIGGYRLHRLLGVGGMGRVFEAESISTGQKVAVKLLSSQLTRNAVTVDRFRQEGRLASQLSHPRCVFVLAADTDKGRPYIVMELMPGDTIKDLIDRRGPLPAREAIPLILDVIDGLQEAHRFGVIHRDVKPSNCFLMQDGHVKIGDFGLSKSLGANAQLTQSGAFLGTVLYASPEQIRGEEVEFASDVYSVCATLYHMLTGQPPFQHENITAALAKIISEDAPPIRSIRPDVPRAVARVVEKGLERERSRRWQTLEELRAALAVLVPSQLTYGGLTVRVAAYFLDEVVVRLFLVLPLSAALHALTGGWMGNNFLPLVLFPIYFVVLEGRYGASIGKRLLGLRVCRFGSTDPPGLKLAVRRTLAFYLLVTVTLFPSIVLFEAGGGGAGALLLSAIPFIAGLLLLIVPMRKKNDFRGMHELISGTCVMKLPRRERPIVLTSRRNRLLALPASQAALPAQVGPFQIRGAAPAEAGAYMLIGEDAALGRRVLIRLAPLDRAAALYSHPDIGRPTRLRLLNHGHLNHRGAELAWVAYVAPAGNALLDVVETKGHLSWSETRPLLEQLAEELSAAQSEGTLPAALSLDQIWVQRDGRLQLLEFPVLAPGEAGTSATGPVDLLRDVAALSLEGQVRLAGVESFEPVKAPVPRHAAGFLNRLFTAPYGFSTTEQVRDVLRQMRDLPLRVDRPMRLAHLSVQALLLAPGLLAMFVLCGLFAVAALADREQHVRNDRQLLTILDEPDGRARMLADSHAAKFSSDVQGLRAAIRKKLSEDEAEADRLRSSLSALERAASPLVSSSADPPTPESEHKVLARVVPAKPGKESTPSDGFGSWRQVCALVLCWPLLWALSAFAFRGGLSYQLLGISIATGAGQPISRKRAALRALLIWLPIGLLLCGSVWFQAHHPAAVFMHSALWLGALMLLPIHFALALPESDRPLHDRFLGTTLIPR